MANSYKKLNEYTLEVVQSLDDEKASLGSYSSFSDFRLTRVFNFGTGQVTTLARHFSGVAGRYSSDAGAGVASTLQMNVQNFRDLPSLYEVELMHRKLRDLGGSPPALEDMLGGGAVVGKRRLGAPGT